MNQLNPDPQGGESNMTDKQAVQQTHPDAYVYKWGGWRDGEEGWTVAIDRAEHSEPLGAGTTEAEAWANARAKAEGATTQPTQCETVLTFSNTRCRLPQGHDGDHVGKMTDMAAQPFPSAGSKPQEEEPDVELELSQAVRLELFLSHPCSGKYGDDGEMQCNQMPCFIDLKRDFPSEILAKSTIHRLLLNSLSQSQPVADGGGLPEWDSLKAAAYRAGADKWSYDGQIVAEPRGFGRGMDMNIAEFIAAASPENILKLLAELSHLRSLLSPEGNSR